MKIFNKFQLGLKKTSSYFSSNILGAITSKKIDQEKIDEIESVLLSSDVGLEVTNQIIKKIQSSEISDLKSTNLILKILANELELILKPREKLLLTSSDKKPTIMIFIGVNGSGKTTTIGKLINIIPSNKKILVAACDTFRAAAVDQLKEWSLNQTIDFHQGSTKQDPASVAFEACTKGEKESYDYIIIDTAGRLANNTNLLNQLVKIKSVITKIINEDHIKTILVLDGTNGSNMVNQVDIFGKTMNVSGLIITKIDGTAKGGALISIAKKYEIPIHFIGLGEKAEDLHIFDAKNFSQSIVGME